MESSLSSLRHRLRATITMCCWRRFGNGGGGLGERMRWRRRPGGGEFRYDPLSYALNFDDGDLVGVVDGEEEAGPRHPPRSCTGDSRRGSRRRRVPPSRSPSGNAGELGDDDC